MIKVAIECHKLESETENKRAGIGRNIYKFLEEISRRPELKNEFRFYLYFKGPIPDSPRFLDNPLFIAKTAKLPFNLPFFRPSFNAFFHIAVPIYAIRDKIDVAFFPSFMNPAFYIGKSITTLTNDIIYEIKQRTLPFKFWISYTIFSWWASVRSTRVVSLTHASAKEVAEYFHIPRKEIVVTSLGVDADEFEKFRKENNPRKKNLMLYVGQAFPRRHLKETLLAFDIISEENPDMEFIAIGTDKYNPPVIEKLTADLNGKYGKTRIKYFDSVNEDNLMKYMSEARALIYVSSSESMGLPPLEALAADAVPIIMDNSVSREIFGNQAIFVPSADPIDIADAMRKAITDSPLTEERHNVLLKYSWKNYTDKMLDLFRKTAGTNHYDIS